MIIDINWSVLRKLMQCKLKSLIQVLPSQYGKRIKECSWTWEKYKKNNNFRASILHQRLHIPLGDIICQFSPSDPWQIQRKKFFFLILRGLSGCVTVFNRPIHSSRKISILDQIQENILLAYVPTNLLYSHSGSVHVSLF